MFDGNTQKSLDLISKTTAVAGMTIYTTDNDTTSFEICDAINKLNCIKMKNSGSNFVISPSNKITSNIIFQNGTTPQTVLKVDLNNSTTYFNGNNSNESVMYVNDYGIHMNKPIFTKSYIQLLNSDPSLAPAIITSNNYGTLLVPGN